MNISLDRPAEITYTFPDCTLSMPAGLAPKLTSYSTEGLFSYNPVSSGVSSQLTVTSTVLHSHPINLPRPQLSPTFERLCQHSGSCLLCNP